MHSTLFIAIYLALLCGSSLAVTSRKNTFYADNSCWRAKLPDNAPILPASGEYIVDFMRQYNYTDYMWINSYQFSVPIYYASSSDPKVRVRITMTNAALQARCESVPMPAGAKPAPGTDGSILIYNEATDEIWEFWKFNADQNTATWGGYMANVSINPGFFTNPYPNFGTSATSIGLAGGVMTLADAEAGVFPYALRLTLEDHVRGQFVPPALRTDGKGKSPIPEGTRFRLPADFNVSSISNKFARMVATALRDYGMITCDKSGGISLYAEDTQQYGNKTAWNAVFGTSLPGNIMKAIPWNKLQVVDPEWQPWNPQSQWYINGQAKGPSGYTVVNTNTVYAENLTSGWQDFSWTSKPNFKYSSGVHSGSNCIQVNFTGAQGFYLGRNINGTQYNAIQFWVKGGGANSDLVQQNSLSIMQLVRDGNALGGAMVRLGSLFTYAFPTTWTQVLIPFSNMGYTSGSISGFWIQSQMESDITGISTLYIDDIQLVKVDADYTPLPPATTSSSSSSSSPSPSTTSSNTDGNGEDSSVAMVAANILLSFILAFVAL